MMLIRGDPIVVDRVACDDHKQALRRTSVWPRPGRCGCSLGAVMRFRVQSKIRNGADVYLSSCSVLVSQVLQLRHECGQLQRGALSSESPSHLACRAVPSARR